MDDNPVIEEAVKKISGIILCKKKKIIYAITVIMITV